MRHSYTSYVTLIYVVCDTHTRRMCHSYTSCSVVPVYRCVKAAVWNKVAFMTHYLLSYYEQVIAAVAAVLPRLPSVESVNVSDNRCDKNTKSKAQHLTADCRCEMYLTHLLHTCYTPVTHLQSPCLLLLCICASHAYESGW